MDLDKMKLKREEAEARGMTPHAGPYYLNRTEEISMLARCLGDFKLRPERNYALIESEYFREGKRVRKWLDVWADGATQADFSAQDKINREDALEELQRIMG